MPRPFRLLLLRHGQTPSNVKGALDTGPPGPGLTTLGHSQAATAAQALLEESYEAVYVSRLVRTHETAAPIAGARRRGAVRQHGLEEIRAGRFEMRTDREAVDGYLGTIAEWIHGNLDLQMPGAETGREFLARYDDAITRIADQQHRGSAIVVSHGAAIRTWVSNRIPDSAGHPEATEYLHNTACITVEGHPRLGWELVDWNSQPIGGRFLDDEAAPDPTGDPVRD